MAKKATYILLVMMMMPIIALAQSMTIRGIIVDDESNEALDYVAVLATNGDVKKSAITTERGEFVITGMPKGKTHIRASFVGYAPYETDIESEKSIVIRLKANENEIGEVVVTAHETHGLVSASKIGREQMEHTQPTSLADLMALLPGGMSTAPDMGKTSSIKLRETGNRNGNGEMTSGANFNTGALGTLYVVDGAPINTDANMQTVGSGNNSDLKESGKDNTNIGVDMRSISTDDIENIEVVKGIPSAEYGNLTSGMINIKRTRRTTPLTIRLKADQYGKLLSVAQSFALGEDIANVNVSVLDSRVDPRNKYENYKRVTVSGRLTMKREGIEFGPSGDFTGSFDDAKNDPDINNGLIDKYKSDYNRMSLTLPLKITMKDRMVKNIDAVVSASYQIDKLTRQKEIVTGSATIAPTSEEAGEHRGTYLPNVYVSDYTCEGKPLNIFGKIKAETEKNLGIVALGARAGAEWSTSKNFGEGQQYDITRPIATIWRTRPIAYKEIPALNNLSSFAEINGTLSIGENKIETQIGARETALVGLDSRYYLHGKAYIDPRTNMQWTLPGMGEVTMSIAGGWGKTTRMPTVKYLHPNPWHYDLVQLNCYNTEDPQNKSLVSIMSYVEETTNYNIRAARNDKWEIRTDIAWHGHRLSATYYDEELRSGFRNTTRVGRYTYKKYDLSAVDKENPTLEGVPYSETSILGECNVYPTNGSYTRKQGIEFQYISERIRALHTSLVVNGAWMRTRYTCSEPMYKSVNTSINNVIIKEKYIGLYAADEDNENETFNTNFMLDTQVPEIGFVFSTTIECQWFIRMKMLAKESRPIAYRSADDDQLHQWTEECEKDPYKSALIRNESIMNGNDTKIPRAMYVNIKATKTIGNWMRMSIFANKMLDSTPSYEQNGYTIRRHANPYFGMEANITFKRETTGSR